MAASTLITGGAGFIGSHLARALRASGFEVTVFDSFHPQVHPDADQVRRRLAAAGITVVTGDIRDPDALADAVAQAAPKVVYHLAAETGTGQSFDQPSRYVDVNVTGTARLIEAIRAAGPHVGRVIVAGSRAVYGEGACVDAEGQPAQPVGRVLADLQAGSFAPRDALGRPLRPVPTSAACPPAPASVYASTKLMQEYLLSQAFWGTGVAVGILRLQNVYGPGQSLDNPYTGVLSIFARQISEGHTLNIYEDGAITRDFVYINDVVDAFASMAAAAAMPLGPIDIGSGQGTTILEVAERMLQLMGRDPARVRVTGAFRPGDVRCAVADITRATATLDWRPRHDLAAGLANLIGWSKKSLLEEGAGGGRLKGPARQAGPTALT